MAGFFGFFDYAKPGKGIDPNEPRKHPFFKFWELVGRKFGMLVTLNIIYFIAIIPIITYVYLAAFDYFLASVPEGTEPFLTPLMQGLFSLLSVMPQWLFYALLAVSVLIYGPLTAGLTYMLRNFAREEHVWMSDIFDRTKKNFKQGLALGVIDAGALFLVFSNLSIASSADAQGLAGGMMNVASVVTVVLFIIYIFMRHYTYQLAVTFEIGIFAILRNSLIFAIAGLWRNIFVAIVIICMALVILMIPIAEVILLPIIAFSFWGFLSVFTCYPVVKRYMLDPIIKEQEEEALKLEAEKHRGDKWEGDEWRGGRFEDGKWVSYNKDDEGKK